MMDFLSKTASSYVKGRGRVSTARILVISSIAYGFLVKSSKFFSTSLSSSLLVHLRKF